jgi:hypothetical protein
MKGSWFVLSALIPTVLSAATHAVKVNADGSFSPPAIAIADGDTVEWTFSSRADSIIGASAPSCSAIRAYLPGDPNELTGPMPQAASGIFALSPLEGGSVAKASGTPCATPPAIAAAGGQVLCSGEAAYEATMDSTWQDPSLAGVFIRLLWKDVEPSPSTFDFNVLDREVDKAIKNGKVYSLGIKAGDDGTPSWLFTHGVTALALQDNGSDDEGGCGFKMTLGNPTETAYQNFYFDLLRKIAAHLRSRADWYRALAYVKVSGANLISHENRLPKRCSPGCPCNTQLFAQHGYRPSKLYAFYQAQSDLLVTEFPGKTMNYALIQAGFPLIDEAGDYETQDGTSSGGKLPGGTEQTQTILDNGQATHALLFSVAHNGLGPKRSDNCLSNPNGLGCPNKWVLTEGSEGQVTGFQTQNANGVANPADTDSTLQNELTNSQGIYLELYEERIWEANRQPNGVIDRPAPGARWRSGPISSTAAAARCLRTSPIRIRRRTATRSRGHCRRPRETRPSITCTARSAAWGTRRRDRSSSLRGRRRRRATARPGTELAAEIEEHPLPLGPRSISRRAVDVSRVADENDAAAPRRCKTSRAVHRHVFIVRARHDDARERQRHARHRAEAPPFLRIAGRLDVARRDEKRAGDALSAAVRHPLRDQRAAKTVRGENGRCAGGADGTVERFDPLGAVGPVPVALLDAPPPRMLRFPMRLPMLRTGVPQPGDGQYHDDRFSTTTAPLSRPPAAPRRRRSPRSACTSSSLF